MYSNWCSGTACETVACELVRLWCVCEVLML